MNTSEEITDMVTALTKCPKRNIDNALDPD